MNKQCLIKSSLFVLLLVSCAPRLIFAQQPASSSSRGGSSPVGVHRPDTLLQTGHTDAIQALALSVDDQLVASGGYDKIVVLWKATTGKQEARFSGHTAAIIHLSFSPNGRQLASTSINGDVRIWDVGKRTLLHSMNLRGPVRYLQYTMDGKIWAATTDATRESDTARIELHNATTGTLVRTIPTDWFKITAMMITSDGRILGAGLLSDEDSASGSVHIWNLASGKMEKSYPVSAIAFSPDGHWMGWIDWPKSPHRVVISDLATGREKQNLALGNEQAIYFSPDGKRFAMTDPMSLKLKLWSIATGEVSTMGVQQSPGSTGLTKVVFNGKGMNLLAAPYADKSIKLWDVASGRERQTFYGQAIVQGMIISRDGSQLIAGSPHGLDFWDIPAGKRTDIAPIGCVDSLATSLDGRWLATNPGAGARFAGEKLTIWDIKSHSIATEFSFVKRGQPVRSMAFVTNGSPLRELGPISRSFEFTAEDGKHTIWSSPSPVASSPDGKLMAIQLGGGGNVVVWDMTTGRKAATLATNKISLTSVAFSSDGRSLVTVGQETQAFATSHPEWAVKIWDATTWRQRVSISLSRSGAPCAAFSPDTRRIAVERASDRVEIFAAENGASREVLTAKDPNQNYHHFAPNNVMFSADGSRVFQGAQNGIRVWKLSQP